MIKQKTKNKNEDLTNLCITYGLQHSAIKKEILPEAYSNINCCARQCKYLIWCIIWKGSFNLDKILAWKKIISLRGLFQRHKEWQPITLSSPGLQFDKYKKKHGVFN